jgi:hypothetical protein
MLTAAVIALARWKVTPPNSYESRSKVTPALARAETSHGAPNPANSATPAVANGRAALAPCSVSVPLLASRPTSPDAQGRATRRDVPTRSGQASTLTASSVKEAVPPGSRRSPRHACVTPANRAGAQTPSRSSAAIPLIAIPGMTAGAGPTIA